MTISINTAVPPTVKCVRSDCRRDIEHSQAFRIRLDEHDFYVCSECWGRVPMEKINQTCLLHPERGYKR